MALFHTILHPTDFDAVSLEAFRVSRALAAKLGAKLIAFHVAAPPAAVTDDGRLIRDPKDPTPVDLWADYRAAQTDTLGLDVKYTVVIGEPSDASRMLMDMVRQMQPGVLIVMGTHGRTGLSRLVWGSRAEEVVRTAPCAVLVVKEPPAG